MKTTKTIIKFGSIICGGFAVLFFIFGIINFRGDTAGWVQSGIASIEIPILIYGLFHIYEEVQRKPIFDYGLIVGTIPSDITNYFESPPPKRISISSLPKQIHFMLFNKGKLTSEDIYLVLKYKQFGETCHPIVHDPTDLSAVFSHRLSNSNSLKTNIKILHPRDYNDIAFYLYLDPSNGCADQFPRKWNLEFSLEIYSRELSTPIIDSFFIDLG